MGGSELPFKSAVIIHCCSPVGGVVDPDSMELGRWACEPLGHQVQVALEHQTSSVLQVVRLRLDVGLHLKVKWMSKLER